MNWADVNPAPRHVYARTPRGVKANRSVLVRPGEMGNNGVGFQARASSERKRNEQENAKT